MVGELLPEPKVLFGQLAVRAGTEAGARPTFQMLVTDLVAVRHPTANEISAASGSDWGIDTYVGRLDDSVAVWQSKFFLEWKGEDQRKQVRESFNQVVSKAAEQGFEIDSWTLCVPCVLSPDEQRWFDTWSRKQQRARKVKRILLWNGVVLRRYLMQPDASHVLDSYFPASGDSLPSEPVAICGSPIDLTNALFVRQLEEAGHVENDAARGLFFAAEALVRDLASRENALALAALDELHLEIHSIWENRFNAGLANADSLGRIAGLIHQVMSDSAACPDPEGIRLRPAHRRGIAHRLVENARAGWVQHWRQVATDHSGEPAGEAVAAYFSRTPQSEEAS